MNKPYIICHMMTAVDGRIDCAMTEPAHELFFSQGASAIIGWCFFNYC